MKSIERLNAIVEEIDYLLAKRKQIAAERINLTLVHGHHRPRTECLYGETVEQASLVFRSNEIEPRLSPKGLAILDCLGRHRRPLCVAQIEHIFLTDPFYLHLGWNAFGDNRAAVRLDRASIRTYLERIGVQLEKALRKVGLNLKADEIIHSETTDSNVRVFSLSRRVRVEVVHR
jgi:hypothetical protein